MGTVKKERRTALTYRTVLTCLILLWLIISGAIVLKSVMGPQKSPTQDIGMFEWDEDTVDHPERVEALAQRLSIGRWYQELGDDFDAVALEGFVERMHDLDIRVYALVGSVEWGLEPDGQSLLDWLGKLAAYQRNAGADGKLDGVMLDIEPYTTRRWKAEPERYMDIYVNSMRAAYDYLSRENIRTALCIPRHYDDQGLETQLEMLIGYACDEVAVMDYDCGNEVEKLQTEAALALRYGREIHCILEFQSVGKHGLTEEKTYRNKGLKAAQDAWDRVRDAYPDLTVIRDYHWAEPVLEMLENENMTEVGAYGK